MSEQRRRPGPPAFSSLPARPLAAPAVGYALSIKQPWAALLLHGVKTVEVRSWATARRGPVLIHAARVPDPKPTGWQAVTDAIRPATQLLGGVIGVGDLTDCLAYPDREAFAADRGRHLNDPAWFREAGLFGFVFARVRPVPFRRVAGCVRFFRVGPE